MDEKDIVRRFNKWSPEPLLCSQGGVPYNKVHLDAKDAEIERLQHAFHTAHGALLCIANGDRKSDWSTYAQKSANEAASVLVGPQ